MIQRLLLTNVYPAILLVLSCQFQHFLLDLHQIFLLDSNTFSRVHVIVETIFNSRTDTELDIRVNSLQSFCHKVCRWVPESMASLFIVPCIQLNLGVCCYTAHQIPRDAIYGYRQHFLSQLMANRLSYVHAGYPGLELFYIPIGKFNLYHSAFF